MKKSSREVIRVVVPDPLTKALTEDPRVQKLPKWAQELLRRWITRSLFAEGLVGDLATEERLTSHPEKHPLTVQKGGYGSTLYEILRENRVSFHVRGGRFEISPVTRLGVFNPGSAKVPEDAAGLRVYAEDRPGMIPVISARGGMIEIAFVKDPDR